MKEFHYPVFLDVRGRECLIVGGGDVAYGKVMGLLPCGARIRVVSPEVHSGIARLAQGGKITWERRRYRSGDIGGAFLAIAATDDTALNNLVYDEAVEARALCNVVDVPERCQFIAAAIVRRGPIVAAISTSGSSPAFAARLKRDLGRVWGPEYGQVALAFGRLRQVVKERIAGVDRRKRFWLQLVKGDEPLELARGGARPGELDAYLRTRVERWVAEDVAASGEGRLSS